MAQKTKRKTILHPQRAGRKSKPKKGGTKKPRRVSNAPYSTYLAADTQATSDRGRRLLADPRIRKTCRAPLQSLSGTLGECGYPIGYGEQHRYLRKDDGHDQPVCMPCVYRMQGVPYPQPSALRQGFKPERSTP